MILDRGSKIMKEIVSNKLRRGTQVENRTHFSSSSSELRKRRRSNSDRSSDFEIIAPALARYSPVNYAASGKCPCNGQNCHRHRVPGCDEKRRVVRAMRGIEGRRNAAGSQSGSCA